MITVTIREVAGVDDGGFDEGSATASGSIVVAAPEFTGPAGYMAESERRFSSPKARCGIGAIVKDSKSRSDESRDRVTEPIVAAGFGVVTSVLRCACCASTSAPEIGFPGSEEGGPSTFVPFKEVPLQGSQSTRAPCALEG